MSHRAITSLQEEFSNTLSLDQPTGEIEGLSDLATLSQLKADPGRVGLASVLQEIAKLERINATQLPERLFGEVPQKTLERYRLRVSTESIDQLRRHPEPIRHTLLAAFCWERSRAIMDGLIDLLMQIVHRVSVNAERKVVTEITGGLEAVHGKTRPQWGMGSERTGPIWHSMTAMLLLSQLPAPALLGGAPAH